MISKHFSFWACFLPVREMSCCESSRGSRVLVLIIGGEERLVFDDLVHLFDHWRSAILPRSFEMLDH